MPDFFKFTTCITVKKEGKNPCPYDDYTLVKRKDTKRTNK